MFGSSWKLWHWAIFACVIWFLTMQFGCAGTGDEGAITVRDSLAVLQAGQFHGDLAVTIDGYPAGMGAKTDWYLGPKAALIADGHVDFRTITGTTPSWPPSDTEPTPGPE